MINRIKIDRQKGDLKSFILFVFFLVFFSCMFFISVEEVNGPYQHKNQKIVYVSTFNNKILLSLRFGLIFFDSFSSCR